MIGKNQFVIRGNIIRKPMLRYTKDKYPVAFIAIAENYSVRTKEGTWETNVRYHDLVAFGAVAERAVKQLDKGCGVECEGRIIPQTIEDTISGKKYKTSSIVVYRYAILSRPRPATDTQTQPATTATEQEHLKEKEEYNDEKTISEENQNYDEDEYDPPFDDFDDFAQHYLSLPEQMLEIAARNPACYQ